MPNKIPRFLNYNNPDRFEHIAGMLAKIHMKHNGRIEMAFIVMATPDLADMDVNAVDTMLEDLLNKPKPEWWTDGGYPDYGTLYQTVRELLAVRGLPDPEDEPGAFRTKQIHRLGADARRPN